MIMMIKWTSPDSDPTRRPVTVGRRLAGDADRVRVTARLHTGSYVTTLSPTRSYGGLYESDRVKATVSDNHWYDSDHAVACRRREGRRRT